MKHICYVSGTRADFGLMRSTLHQIQAIPGCRLSIAVTGMHLLQPYGMTVHEITDEGFDIHSQVAVNLSGSGGAEMAIALADQIRGFTHAWHQDKPSLVLVLGDRGEMLAAAIAAVHLNIHVVHIHGGERSGTIDESFRHAISKLAHYHCVATEQSKQRLVQMGESEGHIAVTGAPGLDEILSQQLIEREEICHTYGLDASKPFELVLFHPVVQQKGDLSTQMESVLAAIVTTCAQPLVLLPNADSGADEIQQVINRYKQFGQIKTLVHAPRLDYLSLLHHAQVLIGNSSSGIIEAASLATPVVNIGQRQNARERNANVVDVQANEQATVQAIETAMSMVGQHWENVYGDGHAGENIAVFLAQLALNSKDLEKMNAY